MSNKISILYIILIVIAVIFGFNCNNDSNVNSSDPIHLSSKQKVDDVRYLFDFIRKSYPFTEVVENDKGLEGILKYEQEYLIRAGNTKNNNEFIILIAELIQRLEQGTGHSDIFELQELASSSDTNQICSYHNISKESIRLNGYWWNLLNMSRNYYYSDIKIQYQNGDYIVDNNFTTENGTIQKGSIISAINGQSTDKYVKSMQHKIWLRYDPVLKKTYPILASPFINYGDTIKNGWDVEFKNIDGQIISCKIPKIKYNGEKIEDIVMKILNTTFPMMDGNFLCKNLSDSIGYIRVSNFQSDLAKAQKDVQILKKFLTKDNADYQKLIIDLRRNIGGSPVYGEELLIKPFIKEPTQYVQYAAIKKNIYEELTKENATIGSAKQYDPNLNFGDIERIEFDELPAEIKMRNKENGLFYYFKTTKLFEPEHHMDFQGNIYILIDNDCFSAADDVIRTFKELKIGKIIGISSCGGAAVVFAPMIFELPNSHILFTLEIELAYNSDGTVNEIYGTRPDIELELSTYPASFPEDFSTNALLSDNWIKWVIMN